MAYKKDYENFKKAKRNAADPLHQGLISVRSKARARDFPLNLARIANLKQIGGFATHSKETGFNCSVCDCSLKDSLSYLDHINGKWHQRALGFSHRAEKPTVEKVKERI